MLHDMHLNIISISENIFSSDGARIPKVVTILNGVLLASMGKSVATASWTQKDLSGDCTVEVFLHCANALFVVN